MILKNLFQNKRGLIQKSVIWIFLVLALIILLYGTQQTSAATKANQYYVGNLTCENSTDTILWTVLTTKSKFNNIYLNWTPSTPCPGTKNCDMISLYTYTRYSSVGTATFTIAGAGLTQIANTSQSPMPTNAGGDSEAAPAAWGSVRYVGYLNNSAVAIGEIIGPRLECGNESPGQQNNTCNTAGKGYNRSYFNYSVRVQGGQDRSNSRMLLDDFNIKYPWCWTPLIYDATVSPPSAEYDDQFTFTINVTNPGATTTVYLWTRPVGGSWVQAGSSQECVNCARTKKTFTVSNFGSGDIGNREFKFNATDGTYSAEAGNPATLGTLTNECLDSGNDCVFTITDVAAQPGAPTFTAETVNGVTLGASEGWGTNWTFAVNVSNPAGETREINLTLLLNTGAGWVDKKSQICNSPCSTSTRFNFSVDDFGCLSNLPLSAQYQFSANNSNGTSSTTARGFTIEKDDIDFIYVQGNNTISNRSGNQITTFILGVNDTDKAPSGEYLSSGTNITFSVKYTGTNYHTDNNFIIPTNSTGYANFNFNATCDAEYSGAPKFLVGERQWKAETPTTIQCYKNVTSKIFNTSIRGDILLNLAKPDGGQN